MAVKEGKGKSFSRTRRVLLNLNVLLMIAISVAILGGVWYLASLPTFRLRWDLTEKEVFTLSDRTKAILESLDNDVEVILIFERYSAMGGKGIVEQIGEFIRDFLKEYEIHSKGRVAVEDLDYIRDNVRVSDVFTELQYSQKNVVIVKCGRNRKVLTPDNLATIDHGRDSPTGVTEPPKIVSFEAEAALTAAIVAVTESRQPVACVVAGRGEAGIESRSKDGLYVGAAALKNSNFDVREVKLYAGEQVPDDCDVLIVAGPRDEYLDREMAAIRLFLQRGGNLFLAIEPDSMQRFSEEILPACGIAYDMSYSCRDLSEMEGGADPENKLTLFVNDFSEKSRITRPLKESGYTVVFREAGSLVPMPGLSNISVEKLVSSSFKVWGDKHQFRQRGDCTFDSLTEKMGQRTLGISCNGMGPFSDSRLVVFADAFFYTNENVQRSHGLLLFTNAVNWLAGRDVQLEIGPKVPFESRAEIYPDDYREIMTVVFLVIPGCAALLGILVWWFRRR